MNADATNFVGLLRASAKKKEFCRGVRLHAEALKRGLLDRSSHVAESLVTLYANCGILPKAQELLDALHVRGVVSWTALIAGYTRHEQSQHAVRCYDQMRHEGISADVVTFTCILKACGALKDLDKGKQVHDSIIKQRLLMDDILLGTALVDMYAKCGALAKAHLALDELTYRDVISWNTLIAGYVQHGQGQNSLDCFECMQHEGLSPNAVTFTCALKACGSIGDINKGEEIHDEIVKTEFLRKDVSLGNALVDMYIKCGALAKAQKVLELLPVRDVVSWSALIGGYAQHGQGQEALDCFDEMQSEGLSPNSVTLTCLLQACSSIGAIDKGEKFHDQMVRQGLLESNIILGNALVDMYAKCGALSKAQQVLDDLPVRNVISWSALIAGYTNQGQGQSAISCMERMQQEGLSPNAVTFASLLKACSSIGAAEKGEKFHGDISRQGFLNNNFVLATALVDMYAKCGALSKAQRVLEELPSGDIVCWSVLIAGYAQEGQSEKALKCFEVMQLKGLSPDAITFSSVLNACSHTGLLGEGEMIFNIMTNKFGIKLKVEHVVSMVALFGQTGQLDKAVELIQKTPCSQSSPMVWFSLMGACKRWGNANIGQWAFEQSLTVDKTTDASHSFTKRILTAAEMQGDPSTEALIGKTKARRKLSCEIGVGTHGSRHLFEVRKHSLHEGRAPMVSC